MNELIEPIGLPISASLKNIYQSGISLSKKSAHHFKPCLKIRVTRSREKSMHDTQKIPTKDVRIHKLTCRKTESLKLPLSLHSASKIKSSNSKEALLSNNSPQLLSAKYLNVLTKYEQEEMLDYNDIYFAGNNKNKIQYNHKEKNNGFDYDNGNYKLVQGDHLGYRFEIKNFIGKGSFGSVCECFDHKKSEFVAIKILKNKKIYHYQGGIELSLLKAIKDNDPEDKNNLIKIKFYFIFRNHICIVFPLLGMSIYSYLSKIKTEGIPMRQIRNYSEQIIKSLITLESLSIIHCDIKPENLLFTNNSFTQLKLIDFGSSCLSYERMHTYIQSRYYRAPEILLGLEYNHDIDMWSLGCIIAEMRTGKVLFSGECEDDQLMLIIEFLGLPPSSMIENSTKKNLLYNDKGKIKKMSLKDGTKINPKSKQLDYKDSLVVDFIYKCLEWDPEKRIKPLAALQHPWFNHQKKSKSLTQFKVHSKTAKG